MSSRILAGSRTSRTDSWSATQRIQETPPRIRARVAGTFYLLAVVTAVSAEFFVRGKLGFAGVLIPVSCYLAVTLLLYGILKPVKRSLSLLAVLFNFVGLAFEAFQLKPWGVNIGMVFHGFYCLLIGYLIFRSTFLPRVLGVLMMFAGVVWVIYLLPPLASDLAPYSTAFGILGEALPMLWLLVMGINVPRWRELASATEESQ